MKTPYNSALLEQGVAELAKLPGIGSRTALRLALYLLRQDKEVAHALGEAIINMRDGIGYCKRCHNICDSDLCSVCADPARDASTVCVVENIKDVLTIEATGQYKGLYHVLGGLISPIDGIGPSDIEIDSLVERIHSEKPEEVILALSPTMEGDTTNFYIFRRLGDTPTKISILARGISIGSNLEFADELTLGRSIQNRIPFSSTFKS